MHMRPRPWTRQELKESHFVIDDPRALKGNWKKAFKNESPMHLELGCGKGVSTCKMAHENGHINFVGIDMISTVLGIAKRNIEREFGTDEISNVLLCAFDASRLDEIFDEGDVFERIYISFCNPWDKKARHEKRRLTHTRMLNIYKKYLKENGEVWFKTDNDILFEASKEYFCKSGFEIIYETQDLHNSDHTENYMTEHEIRYTNENIKIKFLRAIKKD